MMTLDTDYWKTSTPDFEPGIEALKNKIKVGWPVIQEIEKQIVEAACQDSGLKLGQHKVFPLLNKRVESEAHVLDVDRAADTDGTMKVTKPHPSTPECFLGANYLAIHWTQSKSGEMF